MPTALSVLSGEVREPLAIDFETTTLRPFDGELVSVALADSQGCVAIDIRDEEIQEAVLGYILERPVYAFNSAFDLLWLAQKSGQIPEVFGDTFVLFRMLANEGWTGQSWKLNELIKNVLGWPESNKDEFADALKEHGISKANMSQMLDIDPELFLKYNALDAEAAFQGMGWLRGECTRQGFEQVLEMHDKFFKTSIELYIEQHLKGIHVDMDAFEKLEQDVLDKISHWESKFKSHPEAAPIVQPDDAQRTAAHYKPTVSTKKIWAKRKDKPWEHPEVWTRDDKNKLAPWEQELGAWSRTVTTVKPSTKKSPPKLFNLNSGPDLIRFFYTNGVVPYTIKREPNPDAEKAWDRTGIISLQTREYAGDEWFPPVPGGQEVELDMTSTGALPTDKKAMTFFGELGHYVKHFSVWRTRYNFVKQLKALVSRDYPIVHGELKIHGTFTGRGAGGSEEGSAKKFNLQQLPKRPDWKEFYELFIAPEGRSIVYLDANSLEDVLMAGLSGDELFMEIYGRGKPHDGYLYLAMDLWPEGEEIRKDYYKDGVLTSESVKAAKKKWKKLRNNTKPVKLGKNYGMGPHTLRKNLWQSGIFMSFNEVKEVSGNYDTATAGVGVWKDQLDRQWTQRGYVFNAYGRPMACAANKKKDLANRVIQGSGHDWLLTFNYYINQLRKERNVDMYPWMHDLHDAALWCVDDNQKKEAKRVYIDALAMSNEYLGGKVRISGDVDFGKTWGDFCE